MRRRHLLSLPLLAALPLSTEPTRPVRVDRNGNLLDLGDFPETGRSALQLHLDWLHEEPEYFFHIDFPIQYVGDVPEEASRIIPVDHELDYRVPIVSDYRVVDPGYCPEIKQPYLSASDVAELQEHLDSVRTNHFSAIFLNFPVRSIDPPSSVPHLHL